jgi:precorrin-6A/cobalt-precorrin-6A reductase
VSRARILVLGGTRDGREVAAALAAAGFDPVTSLAGVTSEPVLPEGRVRVGGFGGVEGLMAYVAAENIAAIVDATHPFAAAMSRHAAEAALTLGIPILRLERPPWIAGAGDDWTSVSSASEAVAALPGNARALVTIGRKEIGGFFGRADIGGVARMIEVPAESPPPRWIVLRERPPFTLAHEIELITHHAITHLVTKNAGGEDTSAKLIAARETKIPVIMIARPVKPEVTGVPTVEATIPVLGVLLSP